jgi:hypothetical protein
MKSYSYGVMFRFKKFAWEGARGFSEKGKILRGCWSLEISLEWEEELMSRDHYLWCH